MIAKPQIWMYLFIPFQALEWHNWHKFVYGSIPSKCHGLLTMYTGYSKTVFDVAAGLRSALWSLYFYDLQTSLIQIVRYGRGIKKFNNINIQTNAQFLCSQLSTIIFAFLAETCTCMQSSGYLVDICTGFLAHRSRLLEPLVFSVYKAT